MKVLIVGGGLAGLTLANALSKAGIDFLLLEARSRFDPQVGASIGLNAGAMRILDQLGAADEIISHTAPVRVSKVHRRDGSLIMAPSPAFQLLKARFGYGVSFLDRQLVLRALVRALERGGAKEKMCVDKVVVRIEHVSKQKEEDDEGVWVECKDGSRFWGDVVVGCDGVNSKSSIRDEMCRIANEVQPGAFPRSDKTKMTAEFLCLFGISDPVPGLQEGDVDTTVDKGVSLLVITGKYGRVFWFYHEKLEKKYTYRAEDFPKFTKADAEAMALRNAWRHCNETVTLGDLWKTRSSYTLVALEEALFETWSWGRIATVGDNAHKMTPNHGQAGNNAVESAAALANQLRRIYDEQTRSEKEGVVRSSQIAAAFGRWQLKRKARIQATVKEAAAICRMQALDDWKAEFLLMYVMPNATEFLLTLVTGTLIGAEILEYLPVPDRSFEGSCPFNPRQGIGFQESSLRRTAKAAPLLALAIWNAVSHTKIETFGSFLEVFSQPGHMTAKGSLAVSSAATLYALWLIESNRRASALTFARLPSLFAILSCICGPQTIAPIYFALHYISSPVEKFAAADMRLTNVAYTKTVLPLMLILLGSVKSINISSIQAGGYITHSWMLYWLAVVLPICVFSLVPQLLLKLRLTMETMHEDGLRNQQRDLPYIRWCVYVLAGVSGMTWILHLLSHRSELFALPFILAQSNRAWLQVHFAGLVWIGLFFSDLRAAGMTKVSWPALAVCAMVTSLLFGPSSCIALGWMWREELLASTKERHAITSEKYAGRSVAEVTLAHAATSEPFPRKS